MNDNTGSNAMAQVQNRAMKDPEFRKALLANPAAALEEAVGNKLPAGVTVRVVEEGAREVVIVIPAASSEALSEKELEAVAGGGSWSTCATTTCAYTCTQKPFCG